ncbi:MAG: prlF antitoxin for toxin YhaV toxin [Pseudomonadota bacterium]|jgi:AbrB family looped-hinge helix DNA binding protein
MPRATVTSKGQLTIPSEIRQALSIGPGDQVSFTLADGGRVTVQKVYSLEDLFHCLPPPPKGPEGREIVTPYRVLRFD